VFCVAPDVRKYDVGILENNHVASGDQWTEGNAEIEAPVFDRISVFPTTVFASVMGLYPRCGGQLYSLE